MYDVEHLVGEPLLLEPLRRAVFDDATPRFLRSAKIKLTARCNLRCVMCKYGRGLSLPEIGTDRCLRVLDELAVLGCRKVHFSGGEVMVRPDLEAIVAHAAHLEMKVTLTSNLTLLSRARARTLLRSKLSSVSTSLDGATAKVHDRIRGISGSFKRTIQGMHHFAEAKARRGRRTRLRVNFVMMRANYETYPDVIRLAAKCGATEVHPMPVDVKQVGRFALSKRMIRHYNEAIAPAVRDARVSCGFSTENSFVYPFGRTSLAVLESSFQRYAGGYYKEHLCYAPYLHLFIAWDGLVYLCCMTNGRIEPLGDLKRQSLREVFEGDSFQNIRRQMKHERLDACHRCDMFLAENQQIERALGASPVISGAESSAADSGP
ncbi:MAG: radical SAM protein [Deltaproteobacteria bacterium]|nr:radical SAM protein [Deltaproteobacteria bacterium]